MNVEACVLLLLLLLLLQQWKPGTKPQTMGWADTCVRFY
jgi:hypothetical protein